MTPKAKFAITLATLSLIFVAGILAIFTTYLIRGSINNFKYKTQIINKSDKQNKEKTNLN